MKKAAIIDLGSNTFHLLIFTWDDEGHSVVEKNQIPVKLGKGVFSDNWIQPDAFQRGIAALKEFRKLLNKHEVKKIKVCGTATLRIAVNASAFRQEAEDILQAKIEIIDGDEEAELICNGVKNAVDMTEQKQLIIDIGGGSVEFVIADKNKSYWQHSYTIGIAKLNELFHLSNPISDNNKNSLINFLDTELTGLWEECKKYKISDLIGASGSFESLAEIDAQMFPEKNIISHPHGCEIPMQQYRIISHKIISSAKEELENLKGLAAFRVEMIVPAMLLTELVVTKLSIQKIIYAEYALKEGIMFRMLHEE